MVGIGYKLTPRTSLIFIKHVKAEVDLQKRRLNKFSTSVSNFQVTASYCMLNI